MAAISYHLIPSHTFSYLIRIDWVERRGGCHRDAVEEDGDEHEPLKPRMVHDRDGDPTHRVPHLHIRKVCVSILGDGDPTHRVPHLHIRKVCVSILGDGDPTHRVPHLQRSEAPTCLPT